MLLLLYLAEYI